MKRVMTLLLSMICTSLLFAQAATGSGSNQNDGIERAKRDLDKQILQFSTNISNVVKNYNLQEANDIKILPYRTDYRKTDDAIEMVRHTFIRHERTNEIIGMRTKSLKIYLSGGSASKFESRIWVRNYDASYEEEVLIVDPSPTSEGTDDITFTHKENGKKIIDNRKLSEVRNIDAFPVANEIRRDFYVKHLSYFYYTILTIAETYTKNSKDTDDSLKEFMKDSTDF